ncbi:FAD-dependent oxidoreductase [Aspergillus saccharolyticus JOP 1030-1]|uniref:Extracellular salicylate hydroxylase/monooxygenase n=1 Tax=Aspergillus saccharolyticus JOP 1030-1 TaxID=1450539 RepID=A0A318ZCY4_9EURO|nr:extracellular salicylate hydroxylase/monooxygenase [Aspergillus saccharolyticus JOP 1030-1]PYH42503.1 extracellular salicylate hydroxylase/monooxygenase [Aspergillus saccharolyticus JOP 1030-1]
MRIVIVGAGISGLTAYLTLHKHLPKPPHPAPATDHEYTIYEPYNTSPDTTSHERPQDTTNPSTLTVGGGLGVGPNGLHVLHRLDPQLLQDIVRSGYMVDHSNLKNKHGHLLLKLPASGASGNPERPRMHMLAIGRHSLWSRLRCAVPDSVLINKRVSRVVSLADGQNVVYFDDNSDPVHADLVIGADGLKSTVKRALFPEAETDPYPPHYEGLVGIGGFIPSDTVNELVEPGSMNFIFGGNGFFGYFYAESACTDPNRASPCHVSAPGSLLAWWSTYALDTGPPSPKSIDPDDVTRQLRDRYASWTDPVVQKILPRIRVQTVWPTWTSPPLPVWERDGVVLVGDAAHALPPTSGQGSSQALEDVEALALLLTHQLRRVYAGGGKHGTGVDGEKWAVRIAAKQYEAMRRPRVEGILAYAKNMQDRKRDMGLVREYVMYAFMWVLGFFPKVFRKQQEQLYEFDLPGDVQRTIADEGKMKE